MLKCVKCMVKIDYLDDVILKKNENNKLQY
jgi:hypothetical protein